MNGPAIAPRVSLREITEANRAEVIALSVDVEQQNYVAGVADSLIEAAATPDACPWYRAVYLDDDPVGFVMISDNIAPGHPEYLGPYFLWRLLVDRRFQRQGIGATTIDLVVDYLRGRPEARTLLTSVGQGPASPLPFYLRYGFTPTGEVFEGETVLALQLAP